MWSTEKLTRILFVPGSEKFETRSPSIDSMTFSDGACHAVYGTRTPLPDGRDSRTYLAHLRELENEARAAKRRAWGKVHQ
jgi:hypothetical protein